MARTKQTMRRAPEPTRAEVEAAWNAARNRKPTPDSDVDWGSPNASPTRPTSDDEDEWTAGPSRSDDDGWSDRDEWPEEEGGRDAWSEGEEGEDEEGEQGEDEEGSAAPFSSSAASGGGALAAADPMRVQVDMERLDEDYIERFRTVWAMYLHPDTMEGRWALFELEDLARALEKKNASEKLMYELDVLGYVRDPHDPDHLEHRKYNDIRLDDMDMRQLSHDVRCHLYYVFVALKRARRRIRLLRTRYINRPTWESTRRREEWEQREGMEISGGGILSTAQQAAAAAEAEEDAWFQVDDDDHYEVFVDEDGVREARARERRVGSG